MSQKTAFTCFTRKSVCMSHHYTITSSEYPAGRSEVKTWVIQNHVILFVFSAPSTSN